jgi:hypothetical protein
VTGCYTTGVTAWLGERRLSGLAGKVSGPEVLGGRDPVTEPDDLDLVREADLYAGQDVEESAGFLLQDDHTWPSSRS